jgi:hypothetical protein
MNKRIKEIALKCHNPYGNFDLEKFAELSVRECIDVVSKATASPNGYQALIKHFWS